MKIYTDSTLKRLTKDELIGMIRCIELNIEAVEKMNENQFKLLMEKDRYRWHDLRKDPKDLPTHNESVIVAFRHYTGIETMRGATLRSSIGIGTRIIAWKEIEPFEEVTE